MKKIIEEIVFSKNDIERGKKKLSFQKTILKMKTKDNIEKILKD